MRQYLAIAGIFGLICLCPWGLQAADLQHFTHAVPELSLRQGKLWLGLPLSVDNEDRLSEMVRDGVRLELRLTAEVYRKRAFWFNAKLTTLEFVSTLRHDPLSREFRLSLPGREQPLHDPLLRRLLAASWKTLSLPLLESALLEAGE